MYLNLCPTITSLTGSYMYIRRPGPFQCIEKPRYWHLAIAIKQL